MIDGFAGEDLVPFLVNVDEPVEDVWAFLAEAGETPTCLLDEGGAVFSSYSVYGAGAAYPLEIVVDREGVITYASRSYDAAALRDAIRAALDAP